MKVLDLALTGSLRWWALNTLSNHFYISTQPGVTKSLQCRKTKPLSGMPNQSILCSSKPLNTINFTSTHFDWIDVQTQTNYFAILSMPAFWEQSFMPCDGGPLVWSDGILRASRPIPITRFTSRNLAIFHHFLRFRINRHRLSGKIVLSSILKSPNPQPSNLQLQPPNPQP